MDANDHRGGWVIQKPTFARFLASFDFRLFRRYRPGTDICPSVATTACGCPKPVHDAKRHWLNDAEIPVQGHRSFPAIPLMYLPLVRLPLPTVELAQGR